MADEHNNIPENNDCAKPRGFSSKKNIIFIILVAVLTFGIGGAAIVAGVSNTPENRLSRYMRAAERYLSELNYERAVIEYQRVLEIDPMNVDAILGLADAYIGMGDMEKAIEILYDGLERTGDERIRTRLDELTKEGEQPASSEPKEPSSEARESESTADEPSVSSEMKEPSSEPEENEQKENVRGMQAEFVTPNGSRIYDVENDTDSIDVYVKVTDALGNPLANTQVDFTKDTLDSQVTFSAPSAVTDQYGIAKITMTQAVNTTNVRTTVSAKVAGLSNGIVQVYRWIQPSNAEAMMINDGRGDNGAFVTNYDNNTGVITLTFTADIVETSLQKEMVKAWYDKNSDLDGDMDTVTSDVTQFNIKDVVVSNNVVSITVENRIGTIDARGYVKVSIENAYVPANNSIAYTMTSVDGMQYDGAAVSFTIGINSSVSGIGVEESVHAKGLAPAVAEQLKEEVAAQLASKTVAANTDEMTLEGFIDGEIIGMGAIAQAQVTWTSSATGVMTIAPDPAARVVAAAEDAEATTGAAISYKGTAVAAGITLLTASIQAYTSQDGEWIPTGAAQEIQYVVTVDANGKFACMVRVGTDQAFMIAFGYGAWSITGIMNTSGNPTTAGIPAPDFNTTKLDATVTVESSNPDVLSTAGVGNGTGEATLTVTVTAWGQTRVVTYTASVVSGVVTYTKVVLK